MTTPQQQSPRWHILSAVKDAIDTALGADGVSTRLVPRTTVQLAAGHRVAVIEWDGDRIKGGNAVREERTFIMEVTSMVWPTTGDAEAAADALHLQLRRVIHSAMPGLNSLPGVVRVKLTERDVNPDLDTPLTHGASIRASWDVDYLTKT